MVVVDLRRARRLTVLLVFDHRLHRYPAASGERLKSADIAYLVAIVASSTVGALVAWRRSRHPVGWLLLALGVLMVEAGIVEQYIAFGLLAESRTAVRLAREHPRGFG